MYIWGGGVAVCFEIVFNAVETKAGNVIRKIVQRLKSLELHDSDIIWGIYAFGKNIS